MPLVMMTAVKANATKPTSTLRRLISNAFARVRKFWPVRPKIAHSTTRTPSNTSSFVGSQRWRHGATTPSGGASAGGDAGAGRDPAMVLEPAEDRVGGQRGQDDRTLDGLFPEWIHAEEHERGRDRAQQRRADERADQAPAAARDRGATDHDRGDRLQLEPDAHVARDRAEAHGVEHRGQSGQRAHRD